MAYINEIALAGNIAFCVKYHAWRFQSEKRPRRKNYQATTELQKEINSRNAAMRDIRYAVHNFAKGDKFIRLSYTGYDYPPDFETADKRLTSFLKRLKRKYPELKYIANTELGSRGGLHHHLLIPGGFDVNIIIDLWYKLYHGGFHIKDVYSGDLVQLASYFTKGSVDEQISCGNEEIYIQLQREHSKVRKMKLHRGIICNCIFKLRLAAIGVDVSVVFVIVFHKITFSCEYSVFVVCHFVFPPWLLPFDLSYVYIITYRVQYINRQITQECTRYIVYNVYCIRYKNML